MRQVMPKSVRAEIDRVIAEEKQHLRQLSEFKETLATGSIE